MLATSRFTASMWMLSRGTLLLVGRVEVINGHVMLITRNLGTRRFLLWRWGVWGVGAGAASHGYPMLAAQIVLLGILLD